MSNDPFRTKEIEGQIKLLDLIKLDIRFGYSDEDIRERIIAAGIAKRGFTRFIDELIAKARRETRIPDPTDKEACEALQPIRWIDMRGWDDEPAPPREWLVRDRIPSRQVTLFSGEGGAGKSIVLLQLLCSTALVRDWLGSIPEGGPAIYLGAEDEEGELHRRVEAIVRYYGESFEELVNNKLHLVSYAGKDMTLARYNPQTGQVEPTLRFDRLLEEACDICPAVIGLDTLSDVFCGNENDRVQVAAFMGLMRKLAMESNSAVIINFWPSRAGSNGGSGESGSTGWHGKARGRMYMHEADGNDPDLRVLEFKKNQYGPKGDRVLLRYKDGVFVPEGTTDKEIIAARADSVFLALLDRFTKEDRNVTDKVGTSYAPAMFGKEMEACDAKFDKEVMAAAMRRLFASGKIRVVKEGPPSKQRSRIVRV